jgi:hypothetical protein
MDWKEGGENRHKVQCKSLIEIKARYVEKSKREIEEKIVTCNRFKIWTAGQCRKQQRLNRAQQCKGLNLKGRLP